MIGLNKKQNQQKKKKNRKEIRCLCLPLLLSSVQFSHYL